MSQVNMFRFRPKAMLDMQQTQEDDRRDQHKQTQARFQHQQAQQPSPPMNSQPIRLANPTSYHVQQNQLRSQKDDGKGNGTTTSGALPTPSNSFTNTIDPSLLSMGQFQYQQQLLQQAQQQAQQHFAQQSQIKQETNSPDFSSSDMEYNDNGHGTSLLSPISASPINSPPHDFDGPDEFPTHPFQMRPIHPHAQPQHPYGESPGNASTIYSPGSGDAPDFLFENEPFPLNNGPQPHTTTSVPVPRGGPRFFDQQQQAHPGGFGAVSPSQQNAQFANQSMPNGNKSQWYGSLDSSNSFSGNNLRYPSVETIVSPGGGIYGDGDDDMQSRKPASMQQIFEKRKRRRESHNAVERRRRDNINEKIQELSTLLPEAIVDGTNKPNKGAILRKSVDYIKNLQSDLAKHQYKVRELESMIETVRNGGTLPPVPSKGKKDGSPSPILQPQQGIHPLQQQQQQQQSTIMMASLDGSGFINVNNGTPSMGISLQNGGNA